jgi:hypothetical protein
MSFVFCNYEIVSDFEFCASDSVVFNEQKLAKTCPHENGEKKFLEGNTISATIPTDSSNNPSSPLSVPLVCRGCSFETRPP